MAPARRAEARASGSDRFRAAHGGKQARRGSRAEARRRCRSPHRAAPAAPAAASLRQSRRQRSAAAADDAALAAQQLKDKIVVIKPPIIVKDLAAKLGLKPYQIIHHLMEMNIFTSANQALEEEVARKLCAKLGFTFEIEKREKGAGQVHAPVKIVEPPKPEPVAASDLQPRPPVITFMGHVDHGKTSLLDAIRKARVAAGEAGGITQHIGAYTVKRGTQTITFLDTPGHEAFTAMRARGANVTDIVVLVVAADDGIMPTTIEAINHARAAKVQIMVAINKIDLPGANLVRVKGQLQEQGLVAEEYGGDTIICEVSATKGIGIEKLLEMMLLQAEILELQGQSARSEPRHGDRGAVRAGPRADRHGARPAGHAAGRRCDPGRALLRPRQGADQRCRPEREGSRPVDSGQGARLSTARRRRARNTTSSRTRREARELAEDRRDKLRLGKLEAPPRITLENLFEAIADEKHKVLKLIIKGDVQGSVEAIVTSLKKIDSKKIDLDIVLASAGAISESDILLAKASQAVVIGFNTRTDNAAANAAKREGVQIKLFSIIYELIDQVKEAMVGLLDPELRETAARHRRGQAGLPALEVPGGRLQRVERTHRPQRPRPRRAQAPADLRRRGGHAQAVPGRRQRSARRSRVRYPPRRFQRVSGRRHHRVLPAREVHAESVSIGLDEWLTSDVGVPARSIMMHSKQPKIVHCALAYTWQR